jgi:hypothetical protein
MVRDAVAVICGAQHGAGFITVCHESNTLLTGDSDYSDWTVYHHLQLRHVDLL